MNHIAILTPIPLEHHAILAHLVSQTERAVDGSRYVSGQFEGKNGVFNIVTHQTGSGNSTVALATEKTIRLFQPVVVILAGIAGGVKDVVLGDVVVGTKFYGYESGKETETGFVVRPEAGYYSKDLLATAQSVAGNDRWQKRVVGGPTGAKVIFGPIASGDKVIAATAGAVYRLLKQSFNDTTALEMESIGFGQAMQYYPGIRFLNIRGISDLLEGKSHADAGGSQERAAANMAAFIFELLDQLDISQIKPMASTPGSPDKKPDQNPATAEYIQKLQRLIASGRPEAAIQSVINFTASRDEDAHLEALQISSRWEAMARKLRIGTIRNDEATVERSQIVAGLLELVGRLEHDN